MNEQHLKAIEDFLEWINSSTYYEIGEDIQSDYGDGEYYFHRIDLEALLKEYKERSNND